MRADQMAMVLRERAGLEGADLGIRLLQRHLSAVYRPWLVVMVPLVVLSVLAGGISPSLGMFLTWWLAVVGERVVVVVLSRVAFQQDIDCRTALVETWRNGLRGILWQLTILRFSPFRGLMTPVMALERPDYSVYRQRADALNRNQRGAVGATVAFSVGEWFVRGSAILLFAALMPQHAVEWQLWLDKLVGGSGFAGFATNLMFGLSIIFIRPFYAAAGFGLYLSRRTELEGWDIELAFRGMARRFAESMALVLVGCIIGLLVSGNRAVAQELSGHDGHQEDTVLLSPVDSVQEIVDNPPYKNEIEHKQYFDFSWLEWEPGEQEPEAGWAGFAVILRIVAVVLLGLLAFLAIKLCMRVAVPAELRGQNLGADCGVDLLDEPVAGELPTDPGGVAAGLVAEGQLREALSLLIRAAIVHFRERAAVPIPAGATEGDCLRRIRGKVPEMTLDHFRRVARLWQTLAYAARPVSADQVIALANDFQQAYPAVRPGEDVEQ